MLAWQRRDNVLDTSAVAFRQRIDRKTFFELRKSCRRDHHPYKLFKHHSSISVRSNFFAERVINACDILTADQIDQFISKIPTVATVLSFNCSLVAYLKLVGNWFSVSRSTISTVSAWLCLFVCSSLSVACFFG